jgi:hypothetical protein
MVPAKVRLAMTTSSSAESKLDATTYSTLAIFVRSSRSSFICLKARLNRLSCNRQSVAEYERCSHTRMTQYKVDRRLKAKRMDWNLNDAVGPNSVRESED